MDSRFVFPVAATGYFLLYLATIGDLSVAVGGAGELAIRTVDDPSRVFASVGVFRFDAITVVVVAGFTFLLSPLNLLVAAVLTGLVGTNLALTYPRLVQPQACGPKASSGVVAGIPGLLSGAACCEPTILLVVSAVPARSRASSTLGPQCVGKLVK